MRLRPRGKNTRVLEKEHSKKRAHPLKSVPHSTREGDPIAEHPHYLAGLTDGGSPVVLEGQS